MVKETNPFAAHEKLSRREFIQRTAVLTSSLATGTAFLNVALDHRASAAQADPNDPALTSGDIRFSSADGTTISGYLTRPAG